MGIEISQNQRVEQSIHPKMGDLSGTPTLPSVIFIVKSENNIITLERNPQIYNKIKEEVLGMLKK